MNAQPVTVPTTAPAVDSRVEEVLTVFAQEARIERSALRMDARADELGATSLDLALAMFELEARFGVSLPEPAPGDPLPTVGELVQQVLDARQAADGVGAAATDAAGRAASGA